MLINSYCKAKMSKHIRILFYRVLLSMLPFSIVFCNCEKKNIRYFPLGEKLSNCHACVRHPMRHCVESLHIHRNGKISFCSLFSATVSFARTSAVDSAQSLHIIFSPLPRKSYCFAYIFHRRIFSRPNASTHTHMGFSDRNFMNTSNDATCAKHLVSVLVWLSCGNHQSRGVDYRLCRFASHCSLQTRNKWRK